MLSMMSARALRIRGHRSILCSTTAASNAQVEKTTSNSKLHQTPLASYEELVRLGDISEDPLQMEAVKKLQQLYEQIMLVDSIKPVKSSSEGKDHLGNQSSWFTSLFSSSENSSAKQSAHKVSGIKGLYMFGGTGCGKTFIMDLFFEVIPIQRKKRVHFNNFMIDIHKRLHRLKSLSKGSSKASGVNIMEQITNELMEEAYLLCFDEFQVTDIADAMILKSLFESMLAKGAIVVATSNRPPQDLYKNGLQRSLFIPFIKTLSDSTNVHSLMESPRDYRILKSTNQALVSDSLVLSTSLRSTHLQCSCRATISALALKLCYWRFCNT
jgi:peroxisome-assembly ATPase